jgi:hypothetical protein
MPSWSVVTSVEWWYSAEHDGDVVVPASFQGEGDQRIRRTGQVRERGCTGQSAQALRGRLVVQSPSERSRRNPWGRRLYRHAQHEGA